MTDVPQGDGWWQASDGQWYPPEQHPDHREPAAPIPTPTPTPTRTSSAGLFDSIPRSAVASGDSDETEYIGASESPVVSSPGWFSRWGKWAVLAAALVAILGIAGVMLSSGGGDDPDTEVASATTIRSDPETSTTTSSPQTTTTTTTSTTTTPASATTAPATITVPGAPTESISRSGTGDAELDFEIPNADSYVATLTHSGNGPFIVDVVDRDGEDAQRLVNETGPYLGQSPVNFLVGEQFSAVEVTADGPWTLEMEPLLRWASRSGASAGVDAGAIYAGTGDRLFAFVLDGVRAARFACPACNADVVVDAYGSDQYSLVTHAGAFDGEVVVPADTLVVRVQAMNTDGRGADWTWEVVDAP